jgi:ribosomal protein L20A (L18A)
MFVSKLPSKLKGVGALMFVFPGKTRRLMLTKQFISVYSGRTEKKHLPFNKVTKAELGGSSAEMSYFNVHTYNKSYYFRAASPKDAVEWVNSIMKVKYGDSYKEVRINNIVSAELDN